MSTMKFCREWYVRSFRITVSHIPLLALPPLESNGIESDFLCCFSNNVLYPKGDRARRVLLFACRNCGHQEIADNNCVYQNEVHHSAGERTQVLQDVAYDPTFPRTKTVRCGQCGHGKAVFFPGAYLQGCRKR
ncbi:hypothetical protein EJB05_57013, partial [Eragrostis curvula]